MPLAARQVVGRNRRWSNADSGLLAARTRSRGSVFGTGCLDSMVSSKGSKIDGCRTGGVFSDFD
jgi:hypothetical protein